MKKGAVILAILAVLATPLLATGAKEAAPAEERGIWLWGVPHGPFEEDLLATSNAWAKEKFGITISRIDKIPAGQTPDQALQLVIAQGKFPDVMWNMTFTTMADLATGGRLLALDKYFSDPKNYPVIASACKSYMSKYLVNGRIYGLPGWEWAIKCEDVAVDNLWAMRKDVYEVYGAPRTTDELLEVLRKVKASNLTDLEGKKVVPFQWRSANPLVNRRILYQLKGAGWEVDPQKRLLPPWASQETYESFKFLNLLWREGLIGQGQFVMDTNGFIERLKTASFAISAGENWHSSVMGDEVIPGYVEKFGRNAPETAKALQYQPIMLVNPIRDKPGALFNKQPNPSLISKDVPNPDGLMKFLQWHLTYEGIISNMFEAGYLGVHWDFVSGPEVWRMKPEYQGSDPHDTKKLANSQESLELIKQAGRPPLVTPHAHWFGTPNYASWQQQLHYYQLETMRKNGIAVGEKPGDPTLPAWSTAFTVLLEQIVSPIPSYVQLTVKLPPQEAAAFATADERFDASFARLVTSANFEADYAQWLNSMISITGWKSIYETRQQRWEAWMKANNVDDRSQLRTVTPRPEWKTIMGW